MQNKNIYGAKLNFFLLIGPPFFTSSRFYYIKSQSAPHSLPHCPDGCQDRRSSARVFFFPCDFDLNPCSTFDHRTFTLFAMFNRIGFVVLLFVVVSESFEFPDDNPSENPNYPNPLESVDLNRNGNDLDPVNFEQRQGKKICNKIGSIVIQ